MSSLHNIKKLLLDLKLLGIIKFGGVTYEEVIYSTESREEEELFLGSNDTHTTKFNFLTPFPKVYNIQGKGVWLKLHFLTAQIKDCVLRISHLPKHK